MDPHSLLPLPSIGNAGSRPSLIEGAHLTPPIQSRKVELDLRALADRGFVTPSGRPSVLTDEFRVIKRPLINNFLGRGVPKAAQGNLIMITSALPGEGKTFTAINLALSIAAEIDNTVLLVDADVAHPSVQQTLGMEEGMGLLDVLTGRCSVRDAIVRTNVDKLTVMQAGMPQDQATEMLSSGAMINLLQEMASRYADRIIVFDLPPLLLTTEARVMASYAGQLVMVVRAHQTTVTEFHHALATVEDVPLKMVMLNQARSHDQGQYGYGYGYGYGRRGARAQAGPDPLPDGSRG